MNYFMFEFFKYMSDELKLNLNTVHNLWDKFNNKCINQIVDHDKHLKYFDYQSNLDSIEETIEPPSSQSSPILKAPLYQSNLDSIKETIEPPPPSPILKAPPPSPILKTKTQTQRPLMYQPPIRTSYDVNSRKTRARHEPIHVIKFLYNSKKNMWNLDVHGMTKNYTIVVSSNYVGCNCIDFNMRAKPKNILCKHLYNFIYQLFNNTENVTTIEEFYIIYPTIHEELYKRLQNYQQRTNIKSTDIVQIKPDDSCLICLVDLEQDEKDVSTCKGSCKQILGHQTCLKIWFMNHNTCPLCRSVIINSPSLHDDPLYEII